MDRTVPRRGSEEIALYLRTYYSLLRSTREVQIKTLIEAHTRIGSALHVGADETNPDLAAFIYVILRLPPCIAQSRLVVMGQSEQVFAEHGYPDVELWEPVGAPGRRRYSFFDGRETIAVYIASRSDIHDLIPSLTAYQIERRKFFHAFKDPQITALVSNLVGQMINDEDLADLARLSGIAVDDLDRLRRIWLREMAANLLDMAQNKHSLSVRLLAGSLADYRRATRRWWTNVYKSAPRISFEDRPIYFLERNVPSSRENFLYYVLKKYESEFPEMVEAHAKQEEEIGITRIPSRHVFDVEVQIIELNKLAAESLDPRLQLPGISSLRESRALIINIDFPLGMAAYLVLSEIARNIAEIRGIFIVGKAATLNGRIGDVMIPNVVHDEQSLNSFLFDNCFSADDVAPYLVYGTVMDNQKAITALGTFLQNEDYMDVFYREGYTVIEMEGGPFLSSIYEMARPQRYPRNELVNLYNIPFPIGMLHYASDTPFSKGKNLGAQHLSYFGMDPTYATMTAILRQILNEEISHHS
jgi:hypothetical protein